MADIVFSVYQLVDGRILFSGYSSAIEEEAIAMARLQLGQFDPLGEHEVIYENGDPTVHYVGYGENGKRVIVSRPESRVLLDKTTIDADGIDVATFSLLPETGDIVIDDNVIDTDDPDPIVLSGQSTWTFAADTPGTYTITVRSFPTVDAVFEIEAV